MNSGISRNAPCPCGSGKKYKHCCSEKTPARGPSPADFAQLAALFQGGRHAELEHHARRLLAQFPDAGLVWKLLCIALQMQDKDALDALQNAAKFLPNDPEIHNNLGHALQACGRTVEAAASFRKAIGLAPDFIDAQVNLGNALRALGDLDAAVACYRRALVHHPDVAQIHNNLGAILDELLQFDAAEASLRRALELDPNDPLVHNNLGNVLRELGQFVSAEQSYRRALAIRQQYAEANNNLGALLRTLGRLDEAVTFTRQAIASEQNYSTAHVNLAHLLLGRGEFEEGWREYEWRDPRRAIEERVSASLPRGRALLPFSAQGKRILLCHEQGIGDELFFLRFASQLRATAQWVGYWSTPKVHGLIERSGCVDQVVSRLEESPEVDLILPVGDLPLLLGCFSRAAIPPSIKLAPTEVAALKVQQRLDELGLTKQRLLGVTWRGGTGAVPGRTRTLFKEIELNALAEAIKDWEGAVVILQRAPAEDEIAQLRARIASPVVDFSDYNNDLESMLGLLDIVDMYVGVSNTNMHLMAALGKTARVLVPAPAEWRWMDEGKESPWFPGFSIYRQNFLGDWGAALAELTRDLMDSR